MFKTVNGVLGVIDDWRSLPSNTEVGNEVATFLRRIHDQRGELAALVLDAGLTTVADDVLASGGSSKDMNRLLLQAIKAFEDA